MQQQSAVQGAVCLDDSGAGSCRLQESGNLSFYQGKGAAAAPHLLPCAAVGLICLGGEADAFHKGLACLRVCDGKVLQQQAACLQQVLVDDAPGLHAHACGGWTHSKRVTCCCFQGTPCCQERTRKACSPRCPCVRARLVQLHVALLASPCSAPARSAQGPQHAGSCPTTAYAAKQACRGGLAGLLVQAGSKRAS